MAHGIISEGSSLEAVEEHRVSSYGMFTKVPGAGSCHSLQAVWYLTGQAEGSVWGVTLQVVTAEQESDWICLVFLKAV